MTNRGSRSDQILNDECGFPVNGSSELGKGFFNQHDQERESLVTLCLKSKTKNSEAS